MSAKAPPPPIAAETMLALLKAANEFGEAKPWKEMFDCHVVGLTDPTTNEIRIASVLGNAGEVFGVAIYRRTTGIRWLMMILEAPETMNLEDATAMDALKLEFVPKREMLREELSLLKELGVKPTGKGKVWLQFRSSQPGWVPWYINQQEAEQLLADLPRITKFHALFREHPELYDNHHVTEIPFLPSPMPDGPLKTDDLDWRPLIVPPEKFDSYQADAKQLEMLRSLKRAVKAKFEFGCRIMAGATTLEQGRPCFNRVSLLVEQERGMVLGFSLSLANVSFEECAGTGLVETLTNCGVLPEVLLIDDIRLQSILAPLCEILEIKLQLSVELPSLEEAKASLDQFTRTGRI